MSNGIYDVDMRRLCRLLLPTRWRNGLMVALAESLSVPTTKVLTELQSLRDEIEGRVIQTGQVCRLRSLLNKRYDPTESRIIVEDAQSAKDNRIYRREMYKPIRLMSRRVGSAMMLECRQDVEMGNYDFWVVLPDALRGVVDERQLLGIVREYKIASKRVTIKYK